MKFSKSLPFPHLFEKTMKDIFKTNKRHGEEKEDLGQEEGNRVTGEPLRLRGKVGTDRAHAEESDSRNDVTGLHLHQFSRKTQHLWTNLDRLLLVGLQAAWVPRSCRVDVGQAQGHAMSRVPGIRGLGHPETKMQKVAREPPWEVCVQAPRKDCSRRWETHGELLPYSPGNASGVFLQLFSHEEEIESYSETSWRRVTVQI